MSHEYISYNVCVTICGVTNSQNNRNLIAGSYKMDCGIVDEDGDIYRIPAEKHTMFYNIDKHGTSSTIRDQFNASVYYARKEPCRKYIKLRLYRNGNKLGTSLFHIKTRLTMDPHTYKKRIRIHSDSHIIFSIETRLHYEFVTEVIRQKFMDDYNELDKYTDQYRDISCKNKLIDYDGPTIFVDALSSDDDNNDDDDEWKRKREIMTLEFDRMFFGHRSYPSILSIDRVNKKKNIKQLKITDPPKHSVKLKHFFIAFQDKIKRFLNLIDDRNNRCHNETMTSIIIRDSFLTENKYFDHLPVFSIFMTLFLKWSIDTGNTNNVHEVTKRILKQLDNKSMDLQTMWYWIRSYKIIYSNIQSNNSTKIIDIDLNYKPIEDKKHIMYDKTSSVLYSLNMTIEISIKYWYGILMKDMILRIRRYTIPFSLNDIIGVFDDHHLHCIKSNVSSDVMITHFYHAMEKIGEWLFMEVLKEGYNKRDCIELKSDLSMIEEWLRDQGLNHARKNPLKQCNQLCNVIITGPENITELDKHSKSIDLINEDHFKLLLGQGDVSIENILFRRRVLKIPLKLIGKLDPFDSLSKLKFKFKDEVKHIKKKGKLNPTEILDTIKKLKYHDLIVSTCTLCK